MNWFRERLTSRQMASAPKSSEVIPHSEGVRTHLLAMDTSTEIDRSIYTQPFIPPSPEECQRGREIAAQQLIEMQKEKILQLENQVTVLIERISRILN